MSAENWLRANDIHCFYCNRPAVGICLVCCAAACEDHLLPNETCSAGPKEGDLPLHEPQDVELIDNLTEE